MKAFAAATVASLFVRSIRRPQVRFMNTSTANVKRVLIVGCGITGAATYRNLCKLNKHRDQETKLCVELWDKARDAGGRMTTSRTRSAPGSQADLGAQYLSPKVGRADMQLYEELKKANLLVELPNEVIYNNRTTDLSQRHYVAQNGMSSVVKFLIGSAVTNDHTSNVDGKVYFQRKAVRIDRSGTQWVVTDDKGDVSHFDVVVATMPIPQLLGTHSSGLQKSCDAIALLLRQENPRITETLEKVSYSSRYAAAIHYGPEAWSAVEKDTNNGGNNTPPWALRYVTKDEDDAVVFVSVDNAKRCGGLVKSAVEQKIGPSVLIHSGVPWTIQRMSDSTKNNSHQIVAQELLERVTTNSALLPSLHNFKPISIKSLQWKFSQVRNGAAEEKGAIRVGGRLSNSKWPLFIIAGDGISGSNFDNCNFSGSTAASYLIEEMFGNTSRSKI